MPFVVPLLHVLARAIARIGEVDAALGVDGEVVGLVVLLAAECVGQNGALAVAVDAADDAGDRLAADEPPLAIEEQAVGAGIFPPDPRDAVVGELVDALPSARQHAELGVPRRPLARGAVAREPR